VSEFVLGVVGGSGIYDLPGLTRVSVERVETPYGTPSAEIVRGWLGDTGLLFLPRHGKHHALPPHQINYRANICALKRLGATHVVSLSAVGSMREEIAPGHVVVVDQYIDLTKRRVSTFFEDGIVGHVSFADPVCPILSAALAEACAREGATVHRGGTYVCMEGPQFSTRAESRLYRQWGVSVIGMTAMPEAKLAREAELPYATLALATDYDCWHESEESVTVEAVIRTLNANVATAKAIIRAYAKNAPDLSASPCRSAARTSLMTQPDRIPAQVKTDLAPILGSFLI